MSDESQVPDITSMPQMPDLSGLFEQASRMQEQLMEAQEQAAATVLEGQSGGGAVKISVTGSWEFEDVVIDPAVVDPDDADLLADLVLAALRDVSAQIADLQRGSIGGLDLGDVNLGGLGGLGGSLEGT